MILLKMHASRLLKLQKLLEPPFKICFQRLGRCFCHRGNVEPEEGRELIARSLAGSMSEPSSEMFPKKISNTVV